jgi:hypothetical protein
MSSLDGASGLQWMHAEEWSFCFLSYSVCGRGRNSAYLGRNHSPKKCEPAQMASTAAINTRASGVKRASNCWRTSRGSKGKERRKAASSFSSDLHWETGRPWAVEVAAGDHAAHCQWVRF